MWNLFKITNLFWLLASTYIWVTALLPQPALLVLANGAMLISLSFLPFKIELSAKNGWILLATIGLTVWFSITDGWLMGIMTFLMYFPAQYLILLPSEYQKNLLHFVTKWYSIMLGCGLLIYWALFFVNLPSIGRFVHPIYLPFENYVFYIKKMVDTGMFVRFNAFFLEPGHQALVTTFLLMANKFDFKRNPLLIILLLGVVFSFSLAGYLLTACGFAFLKVNSIPKLIAAIGAVAIIVGAATVVSGGDNALNDLIIRRLEYDEESGIKGNNRFFNNTDFEYSRAVGTRYFWTGSQGRINMKLVGGAGYKIYILKYGMIGTILAMLFYISVIPAHPARRVTISFFILVCLCFLQRAYPFWYSWIFPYVIGIYVAKSEKEQKLLQQQ